MKQELSTLNYTQKWLDYGLLTEEKLQSQLAELAKGEDSNTEHYRYGQFLNWLNAKDKLTDLEIEHFIELAKDDPDVTMAGPAMIKLFEHHQLADSQFEYIKSRLPEFGDWTAKIIEHATLQERLDKEKLTQELFHTILNSQYNGLIRQILDSSNDEEIIGYLAEHGPNKKIRNVAKQKLRKIRKVNAKNNS